MSWQVDALLNKARQAEERDDLRVAQHVLQTALDLDPSDASTWAWYGDVCNQLEQFSAAIAAFERAVELKPSLASAYSGLSLALEESGKLEEAERALLTSVGLRATAARYVLLGNVRAELGRVSEAETAFHEALRLEPVNEEALYNLAVTIRERHPAQAVELLSRVIELDPSYAPAYRELSWSLLERGDLDGAATALDAALRIDENDARAHIYSAHLLLRRERWYDAH